MKEQTQNQLQLQCDLDTLYEVLSNSTDEYVYICDPITNTIRYPQKMLEEFDLPQEIITDPLPHWEKIVHPDDWEKFYETNIASFDGRLPYHIVEFRAKNRKGEWVWLQCRGIVLENEQKQPYIFGGYLSNLGRRNKVDNTTGLLNKHEFHMRIDEWLEFKDHSFGLLLLGIDNFKHINKLYEREFGDQILREVAQKIQSLLYYDAEIYRLDSDTFGILVKDADKEKLYQLYQTIQSEYAYQKSYKGKKYYCTFSGGACFAPQDGDRYAYLFSCLENAMLCSKRRGKNRMSFFSKEIAEENNYYLQLSELLRESVEQDCKDFYLVYQPQIDVKTSKIKGVEALLRWKNAQFSIGPNEFIPILEENGLIHAVGRWVITQALQTCKEWNREFPELTMSINISNKQVFPILPDGEDIFTYIEQQIQRLGVNKQNVILEFTESSFAMDLVYLKEQMEMMRREGINMAIDDFGVGYSSLGLLKGTPVNIVKLDKVFVDDIVDSEFDANFIRLVSELCHSSKIQLVQEGVETEKQCAIIKTLGPDIIQGFYFDRPQSKQHIYEHYIQKA